MNEHLELVGEAGIVEHHDLLHLLVPGLGVLLVAPLAHRGRVHGFGLLLLDQVGLLLARLGHLAEDGRIELLLPLLGLLALVPDQSYLVLGGRVLGVEEQQLRAENEKGKGSKN